MDFDNIPWQAITYFCFSVAFIASCIAMALQLQQLLQRHDTSRQYNLAILFTMFPLNAILLTTSVTYPNGSLFIQYVLSISECLVYFLFYRNISMLVESINHEIPPKIFAVFKWSMLQFVFGVITLSLISMIYVIFLVSSEPENYWTRDSLYPYALFFTIMGMIRLISPVAAMVGCHVFLSKYNSVVKLPRSGWKQIVIYGMTVVRIGITIGCAIKVSTIYAVDIWFLPDNLVLLRRSLLSVFWMILACIAVYAFYPSHDTESKQIQTQTRTSTGLTLANHNEQSSISIPLEVIPIHDSDSSSEIHPPPRNFSLRINVQNLQPRSDSLKTPVERHKQSTL